VCGVVGWVDFSRNLFRERASIRAMTAAMALRGPDAEGVWWLFELERGWCRAVARLCGARSSSVII
jgi:asparagine synthetase B (glutamine-hydrolysing)